MTKMVNLKNKTNLLFGGEYMLVLIANVVGKTSRTDVIATGDNVKTLLQFGKDNIVSEYDNFMFDEWHDAITEDELRVSTVMGRSKGTGLGSIGYDIIVRLSVVEVMHIDTK